jgi:hypothetical protein
MQDNPISQINEMLNGEPPEEGHAIENPPVETPDDAAAGPEGDQQSVEETQDTGDGETAQAAPTTVKEFAEYLDLDPSVIYGLKMKLTDDGEEVSLGELKDRLQGTPSAELEQQREILSSHVEALNQQAAFMQNVGPEYYAGLNEMEALKQEWNSVNWEALERSDAAKALLHQNKLKQRFQSAQYRVAQAQQAAQAYTQQSQVRGWQESLKAFPSWKDNAVAEREYGEIQKTMVEQYGFLPAEVQTTDPRVLKLVRDAMAGRKVGNVDMRQVKDKVSTLRAGSAALRGNENEAKAAQTWKQAGEVTDMRQKAKLIAGLLS